MYILLCQRSMLNFHRLDELLSEFQIIYQKLIEIIRLISIQLSFAAFSPLSINLSELTPIIFNMEVTHLGSEASI